MTTRGEKMNRMFYEITEMAKAEKFKEGRKMVKPRIIFTDRELHMVGDFVAVCWNLEKIRVETVIDGTQFVGFKVVRNSKHPPYIDFVNLREDYRFFTASYYEDDDSPVDGGFDAEFALKIAAELTAAVEYLKQVTT